MALGRGQEEKIGVRSWRLRQAGELRLFTEMLEGCVFPCYRCSPTSLND